MKIGKLTNIIGWAASIIGSVMYLSYFHQAYLNVQGVKGSPLIPFFTILSSILWTTYAIKTKQKCILAINLIGLVGGIAALATWFI
jgi:lipid-A-disaccharide synthase-like uncharacterized protein